MNVEKETYRIGEVAALVGLEPYVLRYWETEFPMLRPSRRAGEHGQRVYRPQDVETILQIKRLLYEEGFTIAGARKRLEALRGNGRPESGKPEADKPAGPAEGVAAIGGRKSDAGREQLRAVRAELRALLTLLSRR